MAKVQPSSCSTVTVICMMIKERASGYLWYYLNKPIQQYCIILLVIVMNLTNPKKDSLQHSTSFSKYLTNEDRFDDYNYSDSNINETLLLEATQLEHEQTHNNKLELLRHLKEDQGKISRERSLVLQLCGDSDIENSHSSSFKGQKSHDQIEDLYNICRTLVDTLSKLENKVEKMEQKDVKVKDQEKGQANGSFIAKEAQSILTYSSLKSSNGCRCESQLSQRDVISGLLEALQMRSKDHHLKQENQRLKKQIIRLEIANEEFKKSVKKAQADNNRLRELLRQYQNFNKRLVGEKQIDQGGKITRNHSQKVLSERQLCHSKSNTSCFENWKKEDEGMPFDYYNFSTAPEEEKENLVAYGRSVSRRQEPKTKNGIDGHSELPQSFISFSGKDRNKGQQPDSYDMPPKILFDPQGARGRFKGDKDKSLRIATFQQCRHIESANDYVISSPFVTKATGSRRFADHNSRTFRELKEAKLRISKRTDY